MKRLKYYLAATLDGFIAHADGSFDGFAWDEAVVADFFASYENFDVVLMGRKTYEVGLKDGKTSPYPTLRQYVYSRSLPHSPDPAVTLVKHDAIAHVAALKQETGKDIWLCGGANLASQLLAAHLIDEVILKLNPVVFGAGKPLFEAGIPQTALQFREVSKIYDCGILLLHYDVVVP